MRCFPIAVAVMAAFSGCAFAQTTAPAPAQSAPAGSATSIQIPQDAIMADQLDDLDVRNAANEKVGEIEDVVISQGRVVGYIISAGGFLGVGDRNILVDPASVAVSYNANDKRWNAVINATKEQLQAMPAFTYDDRWND